MRTLAQNIAWLLNGIKAGGASPEYEKIILTHFIR